MTPRVEQAPLPDGLTALARCDPGGGIVLVLSAGISRQARWQALAGIHRAARRSGLRPGIRPAVAAAIAAAGVLRAIAAARAALLRPVFAVTALLAFLVLAAGAASSLVAGLVSPSAQPGHSAVMPHGLRRRPGPASRPAAFPARVASVRGASGQPAASTRLARSAAAPARAPAPSPAVSQTEPAPAPDESATPAPLVSVTVPDPPLRGSPSPSPVVTVSPAPTGAPCIPVLDLVRLCLP